MGRPRNIENIYNASKDNASYSGGSKSKGILDDYGERQVINTKEGTIEDTPTQDNHIANKKYVDDSGGNIKYFTFVLIDADTSCATDTTIQGDFRVPFTGTILQSDSNKMRLAAYNDTAGVTGTMVVDIHKNGTTIMTTNKLDIETTEKSTEDATTQPDLTTTAISEGDILTFDIDTIHSGTAAKGLKVTMTIRQT